MDDGLDAWLGALEERHLADLSFAEVRRGLEALSRRYVARSPAGEAPLARAALDGRGKRAAFALFYGPLHYLVVRHVVGALGLDALPLEQVVDLGCGTGAAGAAWARTSKGRPRLLGIEANPWAAAEARFGWRTLGLEGRVDVRDALGVRLPQERAGIVLGYVVNELDPSRRDTLLGWLLDAARAGAAILIVEPIARPVTRAWWGPWAEAFTAAGGRSDEWRFPVTLPDLLARLAHAARLDHRELTARTLCLPARA
jgi:hypothetical protein